MATSSQQPLSVMVYGGSQQQPTVIQTVAQPTVPMPVRRGDKLPHGRSHYILGVMQMVVGCVCFCLSVLGFIVGTGGLSYMYFGAGIYSGIFFVIPGFLGFMAYKHNSQCCVVGCMVMNIIGTCVAVIGMSFTSIELTTNSRLDPNSNVTFQTAKVAIVLTACIFEFFVTIVHAGFTCASCCDCCLPRQPVPVVSPVTGAVVVHQVPQSNVMYPGQMYAPYQGSMPQQQYIQQQPTPGGQYPGQSYQVIQNYPQQSVHNYPPQQFNQGAVPRDPSNPPPYNPTFSHSSPPGDNPPPYSDLPSNK